MKATRKTTQIILGVTLAIACAGFSTSLVRAAETETPVAAAGNGEVGERGPREKLERLHQILKDLNLTDDEKAKIKAIIEPFRKEVEAWHEQNKGELEKIRGEIKTAREAKDHAAVKTAVQELKTLLEGAPKLKGVIEQLKGVLTPEQWDKVKDRLEELREKAKERKEERSGKGAAVQT